jgi:hypothetical protein
MHCQLQMTDRHHDGDAEHAANAAAQVNAHCCGPAAGTAGGVCVGTSRHLDGETAGRVGAGSA